MVVDKGLIAELIDEGGELLGEKEMEKHNLLLGKVTSFPTLSSAKPSVDS